jgi:hypothetical protein
MISDEALDSIIPLDDQDDGTVLPNRDARSGNSADRGDGEFSHDDVTLIMPKVSASHDENSVNRRLVQLLASAVILLTVLVFAVGHEAEGAVGAGRAPVANSFGPPLLQRPSATWLVR